AVERDFKIGAVVQVEPAQEVLVGFPLAAVLRYDEARRCFQILTDAIGRAREQSFPRNDTLAAGYGRADEVGFLEPRLEIRLSRCFLRRTLRDRPIQCGRWYGGSRSALLPGRRWRLDHDRRQLRLRARERRRKQRQTHQDGPPPPHQCSPMFIAVV